MAMTITHLATRTAVNLATTQPAHLAALIAPWAGGNVSVQYLAGLAVVESAIYGPWVLNALTPRGMNLGAFVSGSILTGAYITSVAFLSGGSKIFEIPTADLTWNSTATALLRFHNLADPVLAKLLINANSALPLS